MMIDIAVEAMGFKKLGDETSSTSIKAYNNFISNMNFTPGYPPWVNIFSEQSVRDAAIGVVDVINNLGGSAYSFPNYELLDELQSMISMSVPPIGLCVDDKSQLSPKSIDFRDILLTGWLAMNSNSPNIDKIGFFDLNRLCDHAILQQESINCWQKGRI
jgi:hypothetical protein